jgi:hypothetical protein
MKKKAIEEFLDQKTLAIVGVSRSKYKFSNKLYKNLKAKGYRVFAVNPKAENIDGETCFNNIKSLPEPVDGIVITVPPDQTKNVIKDSKELGINHIWIQQGAESEEAIEFCERNSINVIHKQCILMFAEPITLPHMLHRHLWSILGKLPK